MRKQSSLSNNSRKFRIRYEEQISFSRLQDVATTEGPLLLIAGASSGKSSILTYRVARLVEDDVSSSSILLLTFTRKAAQQMLRRAAELPDRRCSSGPALFLWKKTTAGFSFFWILLRRYYAYTFYFTIYDIPV